MRARNAWPVSAGAIHAFRDRAEDARRDSADTSVWIDHLRSSVQALVDALESDEVLVHPFVIGELACGMLGNRNEVLSLLSALPPAVVASDDEVLGFIAERKHLLASVALTPEAQLWTRDKRLRAVAESLRLALPTAS